MTDMERLAICPGSFDPITKGHEDIIRRAGTLFDRVIVVVSSNPDKRPIFSLDERVGLIRDVCGDMPNMEVDKFSGLLIDYVRAHKAVAIVKGLRAVSDFDYEFQMALTNKKLYPYAETVFLTPNSDNMYLSSSMVRQIARFGGDVGSFVPAAILDTVTERLRAQYAAVGTTSEEGGVSPMNIDEILDVIDELLDRAWSLPLSGGRCVVDADKVRDLIDDIRLNIPGEIKQAKAIVSDRAEIIDGAKKEAEQIVRKAEDRARALIAQQEVTKAAQAKASEILSQAQIKAREIRQAAQEFSDNCMLKTEEVLVKSLTEIKATRQAFRNATSR